MSNVFRETIADFLRQTPCNEAARTFLIRLRDDGNKHIDRIWQTCTNKGLPDNATTRSTFIKMLHIIWVASEAAVARAATVDVERAFYEWQTAAMKLVGKIILHERFSPEEKAQATDWAGSIFKVDAKIRSLGSEDSPYSPLLNIRSDHAGSRQRTAFLRVAGILFHESMGQWHDDLVADLANVAFPDHETTVDMVRSARRGIRPPAPT